MRTICKMYFGSHVYGTDTKDSDIDFKGMVKQGELEFGGIENLLENNIDRVYELAEISDLPEHVNKTKIDDFLEDILYREYCL
jgi:predicted nucleotidyltransferase